MAGEEVFGFSRFVDWGELESDKALVLDLPHGSGINSDWVVRRNTTGKVVAYNSFAVLKDGRYIGYADFSVRWIPGKPEQFRLMFHGPYAQYLNTQHNLREYLEDLFAHWANE